MYHNKKIYISVLTFFIFIFLLIGLGFYRNLKYKIVKITSKYQKEKEKNAKLKQYLEKQTEKLNEKKNELAIVLNDLNSNKTESKTKIKELETKIIELETKLKYPKLSDGTIQEYDNKGNITKKNFIRWYYYYRF